MKFTVKEEFQHEGITYEPGNTHTKHGLSDEMVQMFFDAGWVGDGVTPVDVSSSTVIQPDDMTVVLEPEVANG